MLFVYPGPLTNRPDELILVHGFIRLQFRFDTGFKVGLLHGCMVYYAFSVNIFIQVKIPIWRDYLGKAQ